MLAKRARRDVCIPALGLLVAFALVWAQLAHAAHEIEHHHAVDEPCSICVHYDRDVTASHCSMPAVLPAEHPPQRLFTPLSNTPNTRVSYSARASP